MEINGDVGARSGSKWGGGPPALSMTAEKEGLKGSFLTLAAEGSDWL